MKIVSSYSFPEPAASSELKLPRVGSPRRFVDSPEFSDPAKIGEILNPPDSVATFLRSLSRVPPRAVPAEFRHLFVSGPLNHETERWLFRKYNALRKEHAELRDQVKEKPNPIALESLLNLRGEIAEVRNQIVLSTTRLIYRFCRRAANPANEPIFDRMQEMTLSVMRAIDIHDYSLGFRFSTLAWRVMRNDFAKHTAQHIRRRHLNRFFEPANLSSLSNDTSFQSSMLIPIVNVEMTMSGLGVFVKNIRGETRSWEFSRKCGWSPNDQWRLENDKIPLTGLRIRALADAIGQPWHEVLAQAFDFARTTYNVPVTTGDLVRRMFGNNADGTASLLAT